MYSSFKTVRTSWLAANKMAREQYVCRSWDEYHTVCQTMRGLGFSMEFEREVSE